MLKLEVVRDLKARISKAEQRLECFRAVTITPPLMDGLPRSRAQSSITERLAVQTLEAEHELSMLRQELETAKETLGVAILDKVLEPIQATCLILYYVACETYQTIAERLNISKRAVFRYMSKAKAEFKADCPNLA